MSLYSSFLEQFSKQHYALCVVLSTIKITTFTWTTGHRASHQIIQTATEQKKGIWSLQLQSDPWYFSPCLKQAGCSNQSACNCANVETYSEVSTCWMKTWQYIMDASNQLMLTNNMSEIIPGIGRMTKIKQNTQMRRHNYTTVMGWMKSWKSFLPMKLFKNYWRLYGWVLALTVQQHQ